MTIHKNRNFSFQDPNCENEDIFERCNLSQLQPNTLICLNKTGLTFRNCNLVNCIVPGDTVVERCNTTQVSRCKHLHPEWTNLPDEDENCPHVVDIDEILVDGVLVDTVYHRKDTVQ